MAPCLREPPGGGAGTLAAVAGAGPRLDLVAEMPGCPRTEPFARIRRQIWVAVAYADAPAVIVLPPLVRRIGLQLK